MFRHFKQPQQVLLKPRICRTASVLGLHAEFYVTYVCLAEKRRADSWNRFITCLLPSSRLCEKRTRRIIQHRVTPGCQGQNEGHCSRGGKYSLCWNLLHRKFPTSLIYFVRSQSNGSTVVGNRIIDKKDRRHFRSHRLLSCDLVGLQFVCTWDSMPTRHMPVWSRCDIFLLIILSHTWHYRWVNHEERYASISIFFCSFITTEVYFRDGLVHD